MLSCDCSSISRPWSWLFTSFTSEVVDFSVISVVATSWLSISDWGEKRRTSPKDIKQNLQVCWWESFPPHLALEPALQVSLALGGDGLVVFSDFLYDLVEVHLRSSVHLYVHLTGHLSSHGHQVLQEEGGQSGDNMRGRWRYEQYRGHVAPEKWNFKLLHKLNIYITNKPD